MTNVLHNLLQTFEIILLNLHMPSLLFTSTTVSQLKDFVGQMAEESAIYVNSSYSHSRFVR